MHLLLKNSLNELFLFPIWKNRKTKLSQFKLKAGYYLRKSGCQGVTPKLKVLPLGYQNGKRVYVINAEVTLGPQAVFFFMPLTFLIESRPAVF